MKKLLEQQKATEIVISVLCDLSKTHCSMCEWEQDCSDNPLLFDPVFARRYIAERCSWLIKKQSTCPKCKLQLGEHLLVHQAQNAANKIDTNSENPINPQCHHYSDTHTHTSQNSDTLKFDGLTSKIQLKFKTRYAPNLKVPQI